MASPQVILITGASTGFGRLFTETLARHGHTVFATIRDPQGRNSANASEILNIAKQESLALHVLDLDVTDELSVDRAVRACAERAGRIDVVINNAGYGIIGLAEAVTIEQARRLMDTNFFGALRVNRAVLPYMRQQRSGLLLHVSSGAGRLIIPSFGHYCASKFALEALAEAYHYELAGQGIESSIVQPGAYRTSIFSNIVMVTDPARTETYGAANQISAKVNQLLNGSAADPQEVADAVLRIVETPAGQRQLRYRVSPKDIGVDELNALSERVQSRLLHAFGLSSDTAFVQRSTAGAD